MLDLGLEPGPLVSNYYTSTPTAPVFEDSFGRLWVTTSCNFLVQTSHKTSHTRMLQHQNCHMYRISMKLFTSFKSNCVSTFSSIKMNTTRTSVSVVHKRLCKRTIWYSNRCSISKSVTNDSFVLSAKR